MWYHVAFSFDDTSNNGILYFNGASVASGTYTESIGYDSHPFMIGGEYDSGQLRYFFPGKIDEVRLYNKALTSEEIEELYTQDYITQEPPTAVAGGPYSGLVNVSVSFDGSDSSDSDGSIAGYVWDFGDGGSGSGISPFHMYTSAGVFSVSLTVTDDDGLTDIDSTTINISNKQTAELVITTSTSNIEPIEEGNEKTITITVYCYHNEVDDISLQILELSNLSVTILSPKISMEPGEKQEIIIKITAPMLLSNQTYSHETIRLQAVGKNNLTSNIEQINIKIIMKGSTPGFEILFVLIAIGIVLYRSRKKKN